MSGQEPGKESSEPELAATPEVSAEKPSSGEPRAEATPIVESAPAPEVKAEPKEMLISAVLPHRRSLPPYIGQAAAVMVAAGLGWFAGSGSFPGTQSRTNAAQEALLSVDWNGLAATVQKNQADAARLASEMHLLKTSVSTVKDTVDRSKQDVAARLGAMGERLDRAQRADQDIAAKVASLVERLDRPDRDATAKLIPAIEAKLAPVAERLDRMERQGLAIANTVAGGAPAAPAAKQAATPAEPTQTAAIPAKGKPQIVEGWILRDVYKGVALLEGRNQRLVEISAGQNLPGVGRIEAIERRGKAWVVVTAKGVISSQQW